MHIFVNLAGVDLPENVAGSSRRTPSSFYMVSHRMTFYTRGIGGGNAGEGYVPGGGVGDGVCISLVCCFS